MVSGKKLVICDAETEYAARLAEYLGGKRDLSLQVKICESPEQVLSMRRDTKIDILLADENMKLSPGSTVISQQMPSIPVWLMD